MLGTAVPPTLRAQVGRAAKTSKGPRALGLVELAANGKAHLIPITILIDGKYYDAGAYKAAPVPMALWSETVYEGLRNGVSEGLFTVTGALERKGAHDVPEWIAEGTWQTASSIKAKAAKKPVSSVPRGMNEDEGPPLLRRAGGDHSKSTEPPPAPAAPPAAEPAPVSSPGTPPAATAPAPAVSTSSPPSPPAAAQKDEPAETPPADKDRPVLKRGKPAPAPAETPEKVAASASAKAGGQTSTPAPRSAAKASPGSAEAQSAAPTANQMQLIPAISDANGPDPLPYTFNMKPDEEQQFRKKMLALAADEIRARAGQLGLTSAPAGQPIQTARQHGKAAAAKPAQPTFDEVQLRVFDLADINEPELVLTAKARMPLRPGEKATASADLEYAITLVVREDVNGDLHQALTNITDTEHLDVIPRLELIDAVDVDGDGRGELLFRQVSQAGSAFVVYRVIGDRLYPLFQGALGQ